MDELKEFNFKNAQKNPYSEKLKDQWKNLDKAIELMGDDFMEEGRVQGENQERMPF